MAGFFVVVMAFLSLGAYVVGILYIVSSYILEGCVLGTVYGWKGWIPCYSQYLWGDLAGIRSWGAAAAAADVLWPVVGFGFLCFPEAIVLWAFGALMAFRMAVKVSIAHRIYEKAAPKRKNLYTVLSVLTAGMLRPVFLFGSKKFFRMFSKTT